MNTPGTFPIRPSFFGKYYKQLIMTVLAVCLIGLTIYYFTLSFDKPIMGVVLAMDGSDWSVESVDPNGMGEIAGIQPGDVPVEINGQNAADFLTRYEEHGKVIGMLIQEITVVDSAGLSKSASVLDHKPFLRSNVELAVLLLTAVIFWVIGLFVFFKRPDHQAAWLLCITSLCFGLILGSNVAGERLIAGAPQISVISALIGPLLLFHFFLILPEERFRLQKSPWIYAIYLLPAILSVFFFTLGYSEGQPLPWFRQIRLYVIGLVLVAVVAAAVVNLTLAPSQRTRQQMKIIAFGCLGALIPFILIYLIPQAIFHTVIVPAGFTILFISFIPLGMGYAVVTQRMLDIDIIIRRSVIYGLISIIMGIVLAAGIIPVMSFGDGNLWLQIITALGLGIVAAIFMGPLKNAIEKLVDRIFYKDRYDYRQIIQSLSISLNNLQELSEISRVVVGTCVRTLNLAGASLILKGQTKLFDVAASVGTLNDPDQKETLLLMVYKRNPRFEFPNSASRENPDLAFFIPLKTWEKEIGFLCISPKSSRQDFSRDDIYLLQGLASVAATALTSAMLNRDVSLRDTFVSVASHELRTPLTSIIGYADLLLRKDMPPDTRRTWIKNILDNGQKIADMVDDLLNVTRIQSGQISLKYSEVDPGDVINERLPLYQESTGIHKFVVNLAENLPRVNVDPDKAGQIVGNLISNAIKYSPNGGSITIGAQNDPAHHRVVFSVQDEGLGISLEDEATLFKTFHRIQRPETRGIRGSGLGLYIVKEWTEAMGGEVWLKSRLNQGSTFFVAFPIARQSPPAA